MLDASGGKVLCDGKEVKGTGPERGVVFQQYALFPWLTVEKNVRFPLDMQGIKGSEADAIVDKYIHMVGLEHFRSHYPKELSGGMKQRTVIAVSTILSPKVLIADEPSSALDVTSQKLVIKMMRELMEKGYIKSMMFITHELPLLYNVTDDIMVMYAGQIVEKGTAKELVFDPTHPYSHALMGSILVPEEGTRGKKLPALPGTPPNLKHPPAGCRFAARCPYATQECKFYQVPVKEFGEGRMYRCLKGIDELKEAYSHE